MVEDCKTQGNEMLQCPLKVCKLDWGADPLSAWQIYHGESRIQQHVALSSHHTRVGPSAVD